MNEKLRAKDLINAGLFTVLYFVLGCCVAIPIGFVPIFLPILGSLWTLITGIPFMLFAVRARKFGMVTLMAILSGLLMGFTGMGFWGVPLGVVFGLLGDRIMKSGQYQSWRKTLLGYGVFQLSGGEKQKIACAGAFLMEPPVFVLDEPSANLDANAVLELRGVLKTLKALGKTTTSVALLTVTSTCGMAGSKGTTPQRNLTPSRRRSAGPWASGSRVWRT